jgi:hypothetical protein
MSESPAPPTRTVENNLLVSTAQPPIKLQIDRRMGYVGRLLINLFDLAEAEIYVFAEADEGRLKRWLTVHFEGYYDTNSYSYDYRMPGRATLGANEYLYDDRATDLREAQIRPGSDWEAVTNLLKEKGFTFPNETIRTRYVRMLGEDRRREILVIYTEDLQPLGLTAGEISGDEGLLPEYAVVAKELHERAAAAFKILEG